MKVLLMLPLRANAWYRRHICHHVFFQLQHHHRKARASQTHALIIHIIHAKHQAACKLTRARIDALK
jgi:pyrrolidone-carboxylate peptidase